MQLRLAIGFDTGRCGYFLPARAFGGVHLIVCDRNGEWVIVDFQNSHQEDFQRVAPKSGDDCDRLVTRRLASYLR